MENLNIKDFTTVSGVNDGDYVLLTRGGTTHGKIAISLLKTAVGAAISPEIGTDGNWYIGGINTNVPAEGRTPQLSLYERGICVRYSDDEDWALLVPLSELSIDFDMLTDEQIAQLKMTIEDFSPEDIALLQQPARDMIDELEQTNTNVAQAEQVRVQAEQGRVSAETQRASAENTRQLNETTRQNKEAERQTAEASRQSAETSRINAEDGRSDAEAVRVGNESTRQANESTRQSSETARTTAESQRIAAETARQVAEAKRQEDTQAAVDNANDTANHPTYVGTDNYVYTWDKESKTYNKTDIYVRGEAFTIRKTFASVADMESYTGTEFREGDFVLINTGDVEDPDNAKVYVRNAAGGFDFMVDMSGAIGFTGKTPQLFVGTVATGEPGSQVQVTLTNDGTDTDGNPKYKINFAIPKGDKLLYEDLTAEDKEELKQPATEIADELREHPTRINGNNVWEIWNPHTKAYEETGVEASSGLTKERILAVYPELANAVTNWGDYLTADGPHPKNALAKMGGTRFISLEQTEEAPMGVWTDADGNRLTYADGGYALTGELSTKWEKLCLNE